MFFFFFVFQVQGRPPPPYRGHGHGHNPSNPRCQGVGAIQPPTSRNENSYDEMKQVDIKQDKIGAYMLL